MRRGGTGAPRTKTTAGVPPACAVGNCFPGWPRGGGQGRTRRRAGAAARGGGGSGIACRWGGAGGWRGEDGVVQGVAEGGGGGRVGEFDEFALHAPVPPRRIVRGDADNELADGGCRGRPAGTAPAGVVPFACDQSAVPGEQRRRGDLEDLAPPAPGGPAGLTAPPPPPDL